MSVSSAYLSAAASDLAGQITHIALVDSNDNEVGDGRKSASMTASSSAIRPTSDLEFTMSSGEDVAGWKGFDASTGGTDFGGASLTAESFPNGGTYTLTAASSGIVLSAS